MGSRLIFTLLWSSLAASSDTPGDLFVNCSNTIVTEGKSLECECHARFPGPSRPTDFSLTWPGFSNTSYLQVTSASRGHNGTLLTCLMTWNGHNRAKNFTLQVAYGPDSQHTRIYGPNSFITDGVENLSLSCEATEVNPRPSYTWEGVRCFDEEMSIQGICVFKPEPLLDDGRHANCTARSSGGDYNEGKSTYRLNLIYPPPKPPEITGVYTFGHILISGDTLDCRVSGGKPLVKSVNFSCSSDPPLEDQEDTITGLTVYSTVLIKTVEAASYNMVCVCSAIWEPRKDFYRTNTTVVVFVGRDHPDEVMNSVTFFQIGIGVAVPVVLLAVIISGILAAVHTKKKKQRKGFPRETDDCLQPGDPSCQMHPISCEIYEEIITARASPDYNNGINPGNSSQAQPAILDTKIALDRVKVTPLLARKVPQWTQDTQSSSSDFDFQKSMNRFSNLGAHQKEKTRFSFTVEEELYTEIDIPNQESFAALSKTCSSPQLCSIDTPDDPNASYSQVFISFQAAQKSESSKESWEIYDTLQKR